MLFLYSTSLASKIVSRYTFLVASSIFTLILEQSQFEGGFPPDTAPHWGKMELKVEEDKGHWGQQAEHLHLWEGSEILIERLLLCGGSRILEPLPFLSFYNLKDHPTNCLLEVANRSKPGQVIAKSIKSMRYQVLSKCWIIWLSAGDCGWAPTGKLTFDNWGSLGLGTVTSIRCGGPSPILCEGKPSK